MSQLNLILLQVKLQALNRMRNEAATDRQEAMLTEILRFSLLFLCCNILTFHSFLQ